MRRINIRTALITVALFVVPLFLYPARGGIGSTTTVFTYGFPFSWFTVHFSAHGGRLILFQALAIQDQGVDVDIITAFLDLVILFFVIRAVWVVFGNQRRQHREKKRRVQESEEAEVQNEEKDSE